MTDRRPASTLVAALAIAGMVGPQGVATQAERSAAPQTATDYVAEISKLRPLVGAPATHDRAMDELGALTVRAANDLEVALALGDAQKAEELERLIRERLGDARWRVAQRAEQGDADALVALGMFYARNLLATRSQGKACQAFTQAAQREHVAGSYQAALCLLKTDPERAATWMQAAAVAGHPAAQEAVGRACLERKPEPQYDCARRYVSDAAGSGRPSAQSLLAWMHASGAGVTRDPSRAAALYLEAARKGEVVAQNNLGEMYENGVGVAKNERLAAGWYLQAAQAGFAPAQYNIGRMYALGAGVQRDVAKAKRWLEKARARGIAQAEDVQGWLAEQSGQPPDR